MNATLDLIDINENVFDNCSPYYI